MPSSLSLDLRSRIASAVAAGETVRVVAAIQRVGRHGGEAGAEGAGRPGLGGATAGAGLPGA